MIYDTDVERTCSTEINKVTMDWNGWTSGCVFRCRWLNICDNGCNIPWGKKVTGYITYGICANPYEGGRGYWSPTYRIHHSYRCYDGYNNLVAQPENNGISVGIAANINTWIGVTFHYKYRAVVGNGDECRIRYCVCLVGNGRNNHDSTWRRWSFNCPQSAKSGKYGYTSYSNSLLPNKGSIPSYFYWVDMGSESLVIPVYFEIRIHTLVLQGINGTVTNGQMVRNFA